MVVKKESNNGAATNGNLLDREGNCKTCKYAFFSNPRFDAALCDRFPIFATRNKAAIHRGCGEYCKGEPLVKGVNVAAENEKVVHNGVEIPVAKSIPLETNH